MSDNKGWMQSKRLKIIIFWMLMFTGAFLVLNQAGYSDGDDAFFYQYSNSMGFLEYLKWRYCNWVGRVAAEALVYLTFRWGLFFWRVVNAAALVLLPIGIVRLVCLSAGMPEGSIRSWYRRKPLAAERIGARNSLGLAAAAVTGYFLMNIMTVGYAAVWVNGSIFYTWSFTCGIWALIPFAKSVFCDNEKAEGKSSDAYQKGADRKMFLFSIPCSIIASMSIEQMGAVLLVFELLGFLYCFWKNKKVDGFLFAQLCVTIVSFLCLFAAPGNDIRVAAEIVNWMPQYEFMSFGEHLFITVQWLISSFANENRLFLFGIWAVGIILLLQKKERKVFDKILLILAAIFSITALLPYAGITVLSDLGMNVSDITVRITEVPKAEWMTPANWLAFVWWGAAIIFTLIYLAAVSGYQVTLILVYLAGIASEAIMFFSPTMYASGERVYYLTDLLCLFAILCLSLGIKSNKWRSSYYIGLMIFGAANFLYQLPVLLENFV